VPDTLFEGACQVTIPLQILLQWDDEGDDRQLALNLNLFDALRIRGSELGETRPCVAVQGTRLPPPSMAVIRIDPVPVHPHCSPPPPPEHRGV
jgi:hypothetical protein